MLWLFRSATRIRGMVVALGVAATSTIGIGQAVHAQGLFDILRDIFGGRRAPPIQRIEPPRLLEGFSDDDSSEVPAESGGPHVAYCVRLCDGRNFPLPSNAGAPSMTPAKICNAMCPAAQTKVFSGTQIGRAMAPDGTDYSSLPNAFVYRERLVADCTCTGKGPTGIARIDIPGDPTLRPGDIVVTRDGAVVFKGDRHTPHRTSDFVPAADDKRLPARTRRSLSKMRVIPEKHPTRPDLAESGRSSVLNFAPEPNAPTRGSNPRN